jgi:hypothetical protein
VAYCSNSICRGYTHFDSGGTSSWGLSPTGKIVVGTLVAGSGLYWYMCLETVPYTGRRCVRVAMEGSTWRRGRGGGRTVRQYEQPAGEMGGLWRKADKRM